jgi:hypothetical protein
VAVAVVAEEGEVVEETRIQVVVVEEEEEAEEAAAVGELRSIHLNGSPQAMLIDSAEDSRLARRPSCLLIGNDCSRRRRMILVQTILLGLDETYPQRPES